ncbi:hypothetical protein NG895_02410 [Aeoliella sp. ICT_H6.2]|uniref:Matrixin n=2 Tax=Aeoliella straminimaris TaxID=2954799 RepID=A0A9X2F5U6_9BACT|nr:hypothetical protein [Aeoliella straminimaris]
MGIHSRRLAAESLEDRRLLALIPPALSSLPGAPVTIHIDFDGNPAFEWAPGVFASGPAAGNSDPIPAFSIDGNVNDFSQAELDGMTAIWQHVAEKYSPFNINVTTIAPPNYNDLVALQIVVGGSDADWYNQGAGGVAWRESFTRNDLNNTGFVFSADAVDAGSVTLNAGDRHFIAESVAHEAGHVLGLRHQSVIDGSNNVVKVYSDGDSITSPIMGGSSNNSAKRGIWFSGPTSSSDSSGNPVSTGPQDDLATLIRPGNVVTYRADDFGSYSGSGSLNLNPQTGVVTGAGIIETNGDQDAFTFVAVGPILSFTVNNAALGGMLAPTLELIPISGNTPAVTLTTTNTSATISTTNATPGQGFVLRVSPQNNAYGSIGQYTISGNAGSFATLSGGVLTVTGFEGAADNLKISWNSGPDMIVVQDDIFGGSAIQQFPRTQVSSIVVSPGAGDDTIDLFGQLSALSIPVSVYGGSGTDHLVLQGTSDADTQWILDSTHGQNNSTPFSFYSVETVLMTAFDGADTFNVSALPASVALTVYGGPANDTINLAPNDPFSISKLEGPITVNGEAGFDTLNVGSGGLHAVSSLVTFAAGADSGKIKLDDSANAFSVDYLITNDTITRSDPFFFGGVTYFNVGSIELSASQGPNTVTINSTTISSAIVNGNGGDDNFVIGNGNNLAGGIGLFTGNGGDGVDTLTLNDSLSTHDLPWAILGDNSFDPQTVYLGLQAYDLEGYEAVTVLAGNGNNNVQINGTMAQDVTLNTGGGNDTVELNDISSFRDFYTQNEEPPFNHPISIDGGTGFNVLTIDDATSGPRSYVISPEQITGYDGGPLGMRFDYDSFQAVNLYAGQYYNDYLVFGTSSDIPAGQQMTILGGPDNDIFDVRPHDDNGNLTINGNLGISGGGGVDSLFINDTASSLPIDYTFYNQFGPSTTNIGGMGAAGFGAGSNIENITISAGGGDDTVSINSFQSGSNLTVNGGGGNDAVNFGASVVANEVTLMASFHFNGQDGTDTLRFNDAGNTSGKTYYRNVGTTDAYVPAGLQFHLTDANTEVFELNAGSAVDGLYVDAASPGFTTIFNAGGGVDGLALGYNVSTLENIHGPVFYNAGAGGGYVSLWDGLDTTGDLVHVGQSSVGAGLEDTLFGSGGSLTFQDLIFLSAAAPGIYLSLGSGADIILAEPLPNAGVTVLGNNPTASPGDTLRVALTGVSSYTQTPTGVGAGAFTFDNAMPVSYLGIETVTAYLPGDYSGDGTVDAADYDIWKDNFGSNVSPGTQGDGNGDGVVTLADYTVWRNHLGAAILAEVSTLVEDGLSASFMADPIDVDSTASTLPPMPSAPTALRRAALQQAKKGIIAMPEMTPWVRAQDMALETMDLSQSARTAKSRLVPNRRLAIEPAATKVIDVEVLSCLFAEIGAA